MRELVSSMMVTLYLVAGLFFLKFWSRSRDGLFLFFAVAFGILAGQRLGLALTNETFEHKLWFYVARLLAFLLILGGILYKNRPPKRS